MIPAYVPQGRPCGGTGNSGVGKPGGVRARVLVPLAATIVVLILASGITLHFSAKRRIAEESAEHFNRVPAALQHELAEEVDRFDTVMEVLARDSRLRAALAARDIESLMKQSRPLFDNLRDHHRITHFYFLDPDRVCLLRVHQPKRHGDRIDRFTAIEAERTGKMSWGIELGPLGTFTLRVVRPLYDGDRLVGYLELGEEIEHITTRLKDSMGLEFYVAIRKEFLDRQNWQAGMKMLGRSVDWDELSTHVIVDRTRKVVPDRVCSCLTKNETAYEGDSLWEDTLGGREYRVHFHELEDAGGREVGKLVVMRDITVESASLAKTVLVTTLACIALGGVLFAFFYVYLGRVDGQLTTQSEGLSQTNESLRSQIVEREQAEQKLTVARRELQEQVVQLKRAHEASLSMLEDLEREAAERKRAEAEAENLARFPSENPHPILRIAADGTVLYANPAAEPLLSNLGCGLGKVSPAEWFELTADVLRSEAKRETDVEHEGRIFSFEVVPVPTAGYVNWYGRDVTERRQAEERIAVFHRFAEASGQGFGMADLDRRVSYVNPEFCRLMGEEGLEDVVGKSFKQYYTEECQQKLEDEVIPTILEEGQWVGELTVLSRTGVLTPTIGTCFLVRDEEGDPLCFTNVSTDITERKRAEQQVQDYAAELESNNLALEELNQAVETANQAKSEFLANMSHEIRTPMTAILGFSDILMGSEMDQEQLDAAATIKQNGEHLIGIINDILDLSKIEAGKLEVEHIQCSPCQILSEVVSLMRVRANPKNLPLEIEYDGPIPRSIQSDPTRLRQILINLTGNAIKFTEAGKVRLVACLLDAESDEPEMQFEVVDSGIGMTQQQIARLFKPFSQVDSSTTRKFGGTGLGLTISKRLAEKLGGDIAVKSTPGEGSTFTVTVGTGPLDGVELLDNPVEAQVSTDPDKKPAAAKTKLDCRVLLAEDGPDNRRLIAFLLKKAGAEVTLAENGQVAHDLALAAKHEANPFDVILMDMQMPIMDGYEATRQLRQAGYTGPIIALTANAMLGDDQKCTEAGCDDYLSKPIDRDTFLPAVAQYAEKQPEDFQGSVPGTTDTPLKNREGEQ